MLGEMIIGLVIDVSVALMMVGIGVFQIKSKEPVGFYSGEEPPKREELTDVDAWNKKHGWMWVIYGIIIIISYLAGMFFMDSVVCLIPMCGGVIIPVVFMIIYHHKLIKLYKK